MIANKLHHFLEQQRIPYEVLTHEPTRSTSRTAEATRIPGSKIAKPVMVHHEYGYVLAVVPATSVVDLDALQDMLHRKIGLASEEQAAAVFGDCATGAIPPIGAAYDVPMVVDETLRDQTDLYFEGGDHVSLVHVSGEAFRSLMTGAQYAPIGHPR